MSDSPNFLTYAQTAFDPFEERPFCAVDSLVFAWLSYLRLPGDMAELTNWQGLDVRELLRAECYRDMIDDLWDPEGSRALLEAVAASPRYRGVHVCGYRAVSDVVATEQFAAMAFRFPAGFSYLSFRGTDSTIVGWKEDFNMAFRCPVPAQESAVGYVDEAADAIDGQLLCGGHSKGGNLAVYGAAMCSDVARERIERAYSHDGPGFVEEFLSGNAFADLSGRIDKT
ncbi:MAG: Mbeg1-like protein, partial [Collinsella sp.]